MAVPMDARDEELRPYRLRLRHRHPHRHHVLRAGLRLRRALPGLRSGEASPDSGGKYTQIESAVRGSNWEALGSARGFATVSSDNVPTIPSTWLPSALAVSKAGPGVSART